MVYKMFNVVFDFDETIGWFIRRHPNFNNLTFLVSPENYRFPWEDRDKKYTDEIYLRPGIIETIKKLSESCHLFINSKSDLSYVNDMLQLIGLKNYFNNVINSVNEDGTKNFQPIFNELGYSNPLMISKDFLFVGDNEKDFCTVEYAVNLHWRNKLDEWKPDVIGANSLITLMDGIKQACSHPSYELLDMSIADGILHTYEPPSTTIKFLDTDYIFSYSKNSSIILTPYNIPMSHPIKVK